MGKKTKKSKTKGKKKPTQRPLSKKYEKYIIEGNSVKTKNPFCPKCGPGVFMANHKNRLHCGKCGYSEFTSTKSK